MFLLFVYYLANFLTWLHITNCLILLYTFLQTLRIYVTSSFAVSLGTLSSIFNSVFKDFAEVNHKTSVGSEPIFNLVPVLGAGRSATSMDDMLTCELFSMKT